MEKRKPSHDLNAFKRVCGDRATLSIRLSAQLSARKMGFDLNGIAAVINSMDRRMFYKSMTSFADHTEWQDVYHVPIGRELVVYLKFTSNTVTEFVVLSFKEK